MRAILSATWRQDSELWHGAVLALALFCLNMVTSMLFVAAFSTTQIAGTTTSALCRAALMSYKCATWKRNDMSFIILMRVFFKHMQPAI